MVKNKRISQVLGIRVYTDNGVYIGIVDDFIVDKTKIIGVKLKLGKNIEDINPNLESYVEDGFLVIEWKWVKSVEDIMIIDSYILSI